MPLLQTKVSATIQSQLETLYNSPSLNVTVYQETTPPARVVQQLGLWDAGNNYIAASRAVAGLPAGYRYNFTQMAQWNYIIDNTPTLVQAYLLALDLEVTGVRPSASLPWHTCSVSGQPTSLG